MSIPRGQSVENLHSLITSLSLGQTLLLFLWVLILLVRKLADAASLLLWQLFFEDLIDDAPVSSELSSLGGDVASSLSYDGEEEADIRSSAGGLIPALPDEFVEEKVWPVLACAPETLLCLCCVNKRWRSFVCTTLEWSALSFALIDSRKECAATPVDLDRHWKTAIANYRYLLAEDFEEIEARVSYANFSVKAVPCYVSIEGLPSDAEECPDFYNL